MPESDPNSAPRRGRRARVVAATVVVAAAIGVLVGARVYLSDARLTQLAPELLSKELKGTFGFDRVSWGLPLDLEVDGLRIQAPDGAEVLALARLRVALALNPLISGQVRVDSITVDGLQVNLHADSDGTIGLIEALQPTTPSASESTPPQLDVRLDAVKLDNVDIDVRVPGLNAQVKQLSMHASVAAPLPVVDAETRLDIGALTVQTSTTGLALGPARIGVIGAFTNRGKGSAKLTRFDVDLPGASLHVQGEAHDLLLGSDLRANLTARSELDLPALANRIPDLKALSPAGQVKLTAKLDGSLDAGDARLNIIGTQLEVAGVPLRSADLDVRLADNNVTINELVIAMAGGALRGRGQISLPGLGHDLAIDLDALPLARLARAYAPAGAPLPSTLDGSLQVKGPSFTPPRTAATLDIRLGGIPADAFFGAPSKARITGAIEVDPSGVRIAPLKLSAPPYAVDIRGRVPFDPSGPITIDLGAQHRQPKRSLDAAGVPLNADSVDVVARVRGTSARPSVTATITVSGLRGPSVPRTDVNLPVAFTQGKLTIKDGRILVAGGTIRINANTRVLSGEGEPIVRPSVVATVRSTGLDVATLSAGAATGTVTITADVDGRAPYPDASVTTSMTNLSVAGIAVKPVKLLARLAEERLVVEPFAVDLQRGGKITGRAAVGIVDKDLNAKIAADELQLRVLSALGAPELDGRADLHADLSGTVDRPAFKTRFGANGLSVTGVDLGTLTGTAAGGVDRVDTGVHLSGPAGNVTVEGWVAPTKRTLDMHVRVREVTAATLKEFAGSAAPVDATLSCDLAISGALPYPQVHGTLGAHKLRLFGEPVLRSNPSVAITTEGDTYRLNVSAFDSVQGVVRVRPATTEADVELSFDGLATRDIIPASVDHGTGAVLTGTLSGRYQSEKLKVQASLQRLDLLTDELMMSAARPAQISLDGKTAQFDIDLSGKGGHLRVTGYAGDKLGVEANGRVELALLSPAFRSAARVLGPIGIDVVVGGTREHPQITGELTVLEKLTLQPRQLIREIHIDRGHIRLEPEQVTISGVSGGSGEGRFQSTGTVTLKNGRPARFNIGVDGQNLALRLGDLSLEATTSMRLKGDPAAPKLSGTVDLVRGRYLRTLALQDFNFVAREPELTEPDADPPAILQALELDLHASSDDSMSVKVDAGAMGVDTTFGADLRIEGTAARPLVEGQVSADQGYIDFPSARLAITRIAIDFVPNVDATIDPTIDLVAEGEVEAAAHTSNAHTYYVTLRLTGTAKAMTLELEAAGLTRAQILALLLTGTVDLQTLLGEQDDDSTSIDTALAFAGSQLTGPIARFLERRLEDALNLHVELQAEVSSRDVRVSAAHDINRRIRIEGAYQHEFDSEKTTTSARGRLLLTDSLFIEGEAEQVQSANTTGDKGQRGLIEIKLRIIGHD